MYLVEGAGSERDVSLAEGTGEEAEGGDDGGDDDVLRLLHSLHPAWWVLLHIVGLGGQVDHRDHLINWSARELDDN